MNWIDFIILFIIIIAVILGFYRGFIIGVLDIITWLSSFVLAYLFYPYTAIGLDKIGNLGVWRLPLAFLLTALVARILIGFIRNLIARNIPATANENGINKFLGIIPGIINGGIYAIIFSALLLSFPLRDGLTNNIRESRFGPQLAMQADWANRKLAPIMNDAIRQTMNSLTIQRPESHEKVNLPYKFDRAKVRPDLEAEMLVMVNKERQKNGLQILQADPEMTQVARAHSQDMFVKGYFSHNNLEGKDPFQRMRDANVRFLDAGENLALAQTLEIAHKNLMNSPGHRANILSPHFHRLGIGILDGGFYGLMISQEFRD
jgi:uncharacterized protein YkwD